MTGVEAGGLRIEEGQHAARFAGGRIGILQGTRTYVLQNSDGQVNATHSVSAGLDYAAIGPEHSMLHDQGRVDYTHVGDQEAVDAFNRLSRSEGILPALETAHGIAYVLRLAPTLARDQIIIANCSGRGDKDVAQLSEWEKRQAAGTPAP